MAFGWSRSGTSRAALLALAAASAGVAGSMLEVASSGAVASVRPSVAGEARLAAALAPAETTRSADAGTPVGPPVPAGRLFGLVTSYTAASGGSDGELVLRQADGSALTVTTTASTRFVAAGAYAEPARLGRVRSGRSNGGSPSGSAVYSVVVLPGDDAFVVPAGPSTGTVAGTATPSSAVVAAVVGVEQPQLSGTIDAIAGSTITISDAQLFLHTIDVSGSPTVTEGGQSVALGSLAVGSEILAIGQIDLASQSVLHATSIRVLVQSAVGTVASVSAPSFTLTSRSGALQVTTNAATRFVAAGAVSTFQSITPNEHVAVLGMRQPGGMLASVVFVQPAGEGRGGAPPGPTGAVPLSPTGAVPLSPTGAGSRGSGGESGGRGRR